MDGRGSHQKHIGLTTSETQGGGGGALLTTSSGMGGNRLKAVS